MSCFCLWLLTSSSILSISFFAFLYQFQRFLSFYHLATLWSTCCQLSPAFLYSIVPPAFHHRWCRSWLLCWFFRCVRRVSISHACARNWKSAREDFARVQVRAGVSRDAMPASQLTSALPEAFVNSYTVILVATLFALSNWPFQVLIFDIFANIISTLSHPISCCCVGSCNKSCCLPVYPVVSCYLCVYLSISLVFCCLAVLS